MSGAEARLAASRILMAVTENRQTLDTALTATALYRRLSDPDRRFARAMASAALRVLGRIDAGLRPLLDRPLDAASPPVRALLRIGAAQGWTMGTPAHALVDATVAAARLCPRTRHATGFVNAVLRKVATGQGAFDQAPDEAAWPQWLQTMMVEQMGPQVCAALAKAQTQPADLYLTPKDGDAERLAARLKGDIIADHSVRIDRQQTVTDLSGFADGDWWVQDVAAAQAARLLRVQPGDTVFDMCAAPGGKTMQLAATGAQVMAVDRSPARLKRLAQNLARTGLSAYVKSVEADAMVWKPGRLADKILLDAPCSALGTLQRHPEGAWIKSEIDIVRLQTVQKDLLHAVSGLLKPGGILVYCVCSPLPQEGEAVIRNLLEMGGLQRAMIMAGEVPGFETNLTKAGDVLTLPGNAAFTHDAFYISRLRKL